MGLTWVAQSGRWYPGTGPAWIGLIGAVSGASLVCIYLATQIDPSLTRLDLRLGSTARRRKLAFGLLLGLALGLPAGLAVWLIFGLVFGLQDALLFGVIFTLVLGLALGLMFGLEGNFSLAEKPTSVMRQNVTFAVTAWLVFGLAACLVFGFVVGPGFGLASGLAFGLLLGLASGLAAWIRYLIGSSRARRRGLLPRHVGLFFDWAYKANLLRMSGTAIQFRHRQLQAWLTTPAPVVPAPAGPADPVCQANDEAIT